MRDDGERFSYTAQRDAYLTVVGALLLLLVVETGLWVLLVGALIHNGGVRLALHLLMAAATVASLVALLAPAFTAHHLSATQFTLRYGFFTARLPRAAIAQAEPARTQVDAFQSLLPRYDEKRRRLVIAFSDTGQVEMRLREPYPMRVGRRERLVESLLLNVDRRDALLAALDADAAHTGDAASVAS
jgi:hypothetical protein